MLTTSPETTSFPIVSRAARTRLSMTVVRPNGWTAILAGAGHISPAGKAQRSRCEPGAVPQLRCLRSGGRTSQVACSLPTNSALGGRAVRAAPPPSHLPPLHAEVFYGPRSRYRRGSRPGGTRPRGVRPPPHAPGGDRRPRIVSLSPTATEDLFAIGAGKQVVAVDDQSNYPANAPHTKLSGYTPNAEAIAGYQPDLVVVSVDAQRHRRGAREAEDPGARRADGRDARRAPTPRSRSSARRPGTPRGAAAVVARMKAQIAASGRVGAEGRRGSPSTTSSSPIYYSATSKTFIGRVYTLLGLKNIADAADKTRLRLPEALAASTSSAASPKLIVLADTKCCGQTAGEASAKRAGLGDDRGRQGRRRGRGQRRRRLALGAAGRRLRPGRSRRGVGRC